MIPSKYQQTIYSWIQTGFGNGIVEAVAGSGKTTTIVNATKVIPADKKICFLAFNKSIAEELKTKLPAHCEASTLNSLGHRAWMRHMQSVKLDSNKTSTIMFDCLTDDEMRQFGANIKRLVSLAKAHLVVPKSVYADQKIGTEDNEDVWLGFIDKYDIELNIQADVSDKEFQKQTSDCIKLAQRVLELSCEVKNIIDFDDQIYLTTVFKARMGRYDFVFVDEAQDLNPAQMTMIQSLSGRIVAIGDSRQCHPAGTMVEVTGGTRIPIESITAGTQVVTYHDCFRGLKTQGRKVLETSSRKYAGDMLTIHAGKEVVRVTPNHRVPTRLNGKKKCWAIYLMEKDKTTRIGCCVAMYKQGFGPALRMRQERTDRGWVLAVFNNEKEARIQETLISLKFGIPEKIFFGKGKYKEDLINAIGDNSLKAKECLTAFNRMYEYPLFDKKSDKHIGRYVYITEATNLIDGLNEMCTFSGIQKGNWQRIAISRKYEETTVYSISVQPTEGGHRLYVADNILVHNCIYGFRGAGTDSMTKFKEKFNATSLELSICYRCPKSHIALAKTIVPQIEASETAQEGEIQKLGQKWDSSIFSSTDLVICRINASLVKLAYMLLSEKIPVRILGRDIGAGLISLIRKMKTTSTKELTYKLQKWMDRECDKLRRKDPDADCSKIEDKYETITTFIDMFPDAQPEGICKEIETMYSDNTKGILTLSTIHRSKGLEADKVFILNSWLMPMKSARQPWQQQQEQNLQYVAYTRAKKSLVFIDITKDGKK